MKTLTKSNGLWTGSLQKHMAVSRREMNKSYGLQQAQLARMNIVRDSQRLQLSAADTLVRLEQLKDEIKKNLYKPPPKIETIKVVPYGDLYDEENRLPLKTRSLGVVPNSNPALVSTIVPYGDLYDEDASNLRTEAQTNSKSILNDLISKIGEEEEGKPDPPTLRERVGARAKSASPKKSKGITIEIPTKKAASSTKKAASPTPSVASTTTSEAPTVSTSTTAQLGETIDMPKPLTFFEERKILKEAVNRSQMSNKDKNKALNDIKQSKSIAMLKDIENVLINNTPSFSASDLIGNGIKLKYQYSTRK